MPAPHAATEDAALIEACRRGAPRAWEALVQRFERLIYTVPRRAGLSAEGAADVFQTVFMRLHERLDSLQQPDRVRAWLVTSARRETLRLLAEQRRSIALPAFDGDDDAISDEPVDPDPLPDALLEQLQLQHRARVALERMAEPCRSLLGLLYGSDEPPPYDRISQQLSMPQGSIGPTRARCLAKLRRVLETTR